jgi:FAD/FMN-containing dehydrogenase
MKVSKLFLLLFTLIVIVVVITANNHYVKDFANIHTAIPYRTFEPTNEDQIMHILKKYENMKISIAGSKYSHGDHTMKDGGLYIDMKNMNRILELKNGIVKVQSGTTWSKLIKFLNKFNLSVAEMQSYSSFSVGGSVSVNCHGRSTIYGTIGDTVEELKVMTSDGNIIYCSRDHNDDIFRACIGGYGGIAIILEVSLKTTDNCHIERKIINAKSESLQELLELPKSGIETGLVFFNINIYPAAQYKNKKRHDLFCVLWYKTDKAI